MAAIHLGTLAKAAMERHRGQSPDGPAIGFRKVSESLPPESRHAFEVFVCQLESEINAHRSKFLEQCISAHGASLIELIENHCLEEFDIQTRFLTNVPVSSAQTSDVAIYTHFLDRLKTQTLETLSAELSKYSVEVRDEVVARVALKLAARTCTWLASAYAGTQQRLEEGTSGTTSMRDIGRVETADGETETGKVKESSRKEFLDLLSTPANPDQTKRPHEHPAVATAAARTSSMPLAAALESKAEAEVSLPRRRGYRKEVRVWMDKLGLQTISQGAKRLGVSESTFKSIMSDKGKQRYSEDTLRRVLSTIGHAEQ